MRKLRSLIQSLSKDEQEEIYFDLQEYLLDSYDKKARWVNGKYDTFVKEAEFYEIVDNLIKHLKRKVRRTKK